MSPFGGRIGGLLVWVGVRGGLSQGLNGKKEMRNTLDFGRKN